MGLCGGGYDCPSDSCLFFKKYYLWQETHFTDTEEKSILDLWNGECLFNNRRSNARGVAKNLVLYTYKLHICFGEMGFIFCG